MGMLASRLQDQRAVRAALAALTEALGDADQMVFNWAARELDRMALSVSDADLLGQCVPPLIDALDRENSLLAAWALARLAPKAEDPAALRPAIAPLVELLRNGEAQPRWAGASALGGIAPKT